MQRPPPGAYPMATAAAGAPAGAGGPFGMQGQTHGLLPPSSAPPGGMPPMGVPQRVQMPSHVTATGYQGRPMVGGPPPQQMRPGMRPASQPGYPPAVPNSGMRMGMQHGMNSMVRMDQIAAQGNLAAMGSQHQHPPPPGAGGPVPAAGIRDQRHYQEQKIRQQQQLMSSQAQMQKLQPHLSHLQPQQAPPGPDLRQQPGQIQRTPSAAGMHPTPHMMQPPPQMSGQNFQNPPMQNHTPHIPQQHPMGGQRVSTPQPPGPSIPRTPSMGPPGPSSQQNRTPSAQMNADQFMAMNAFNSPQPGQPGHPPPNLHQSPFPPPNQQQRMPHPNPNMFPPHEFQQHPGQNQPPFPDMHNHPPPQNNHQNQNPAAQWQNQQPQPGPSNHASPPPTQFLPPQTPTSRPPSTTVHAQQHQQQQQQHPNSTNTNMPPPHPTPMTPMPPPPPRPMSQQGRPASRASSHPSRTPRSAHATIPANAMQSSQQQAMRHQQQQPPPSQQQQPPTRGPPQPLPTPHAQAPPPPPHQQQTPMQIQQHQHQQPVAGPSRTPQRPPSVAKSEDTIKTEPGSSQPPPPSEASPQSKPSPNPKPTDYLIPLALGKGGALARLMEFNHLFSIPWSEPRNRLDWWNMMLNDFFTPRAMMRLTLIGDVKEGGEEHGMSGEPRGSVKAFEVNLPVLPRFFLVMQQSGLTQMSLTVDGHHEREIPGSPGHVHLESTNASWYFSYASGHVVILRGPFHATLALTTPSGSAVGSELQREEVLRGECNLKFEDFNFESRGVEKYVNLKKVSGNRMRGGVGQGQGQVEAKEKEGVSAGAVKVENVGKGAAAKRKRGAAAANVEEDVAPVAVNGDVTMKEEDVSGSGSSLDAGSGVGGGMDEPPIYMERCTIPGEPVGEFGVPSEILRCLELADSVKWMGDLIEFSMRGQRGAFDALAGFASSIRTHEPNLPRIPGPGGLYQQQQQLPYAQARMEAVFGQHQHHPQYQRMAPMPGGYHPPPFVNGAPPPPFPAFGGYPQPTTLFSGLPASLTSAANPMAPQHSQPQPQQQQQQQPPGQTQGQTQQQQPTPQSTPQQAPASPRKAQTLPTPPSTAAASKAGGNALKRKAGDGEAGTAPPPKRATRKKSKAG